MTVTELLKRMSEAYRGFDAKASAAFAAPFRARLSSFEGDALNEAAVLVLSKFRPSSVRPFPLPADFEEHLPKMVLKLPSDGPKVDFGSHRERKQRLLADWQNRQYPKILLARGKRIADACAWEAGIIADRRAWHELPRDVVLTHEQIQICEDRAVSQLRMQLFGAMVLRRTDGTAKAQADWCREILRLNKDPDTEPTPWQRLGAPVARHKAMTALQRLGQEIDAA